MVSPPELVCKDLNSQSTGSFKDFACLNVFEGRRHWHWLGRGAFPNIVNVYVKIEEPY